MYLWAFRLPYVEGNVFQSSFVPLIIIKIITDLIFLLFSKNIKGPLSSINYVDKVSIDIKISFLSLPYPFFIPFLETRAACLFSIFFRKDYCFYLKIIVIFFPFFSLFSNKLSSSSSLFLWIFFCVFPSAASFCLLCQLLCVKPLCCDFHILYFFSLHSILYFIFLLSWFCRPSSLLD